MEALSADLMLKLLPVNVALVAAIVAFGNFVPKVWEMVEKKQMGGQQLSLEERGLLDGLKQSQRWVTCAVNFIFASTVWELGYIGLSEIHVPWPWWVVPICSLIGPALATGGFIFIYVWIMPWWRYLGYILKK